MLKNRNNKMSGSNDLKIPEILKRYKAEDFITRMKANFFYKVGIAMFVFMIMIIITTILIQYKHFGGVQYYIIIAELILTANIALSVIFIVRKKLGIAIHMLINGCLMVIWLILFTNEIETLARFDTISFVFGTIALTPLITHNNKKNILIYTGFNILALAALSFYTYHSSQVTEGDILDYFTDNVMAILYLGVVVYNISSIYNKAIDRTEQALQTTKNAESEIKELNEELEERVKQRTAELESANKELNRFAYIVSHDLKAPLRGIGQVAQWLDTDYREVLDEDGRNALNLLTGRVKILDNLIEGILRYSRIGRESLENKETDLNKIIEEIIEIISPPLHIKITYDKLPVIIVDPTRIEQLFQNLISNAIKFIDKPEGEIHISNKDKGDYWLFSVSDNGPGIDKKYFDKIFTIFQTLSSKDDSGNTGIGLSIVKKIVELYHGEIWLESELGRGTTFFFTIKKIK